MHGTLERFSFTSRCLSDNPLGDSAERDVYVYVPRGAEGKRLPTVTVLAGYGGTNHSMVGYVLWKPNVVERFDRLVQEGRSKPAYLILPDAVNRWGGSQFLDSEATGRYQTYVADEVVDEVDKRYRTIPKREGRAVVGRSSGGFGALRFGTDRADRFYAVGSHAADGAFDLSLRPMFVPAAIAYERSGGVAAFGERLTREGPTSSMDFDAAFVLAAAAAYGSVTLSDHPFVELPFDGKTGEVRPEIWEPMLEHDPVRKIPKCKEALQSLGYVFVDAGNRDEHGLHFAARQIRDALTQIGVELDYEEFEGGHRGTGFRYDESLPRLVSKLAGG